MPTFHSETSFDHQLLKSMPFHQTRFVQPMSIMMVWTELFRNNILYQFVHLCKKHIRFVHLVQMPRLQKRWEESRSSIHIIYIVFWICPQEIISSTLHSWSNRTDSAGLASSWLRLLKVNHIRSISMSYCACIIGASISEPHVDELLCISICHTCTLGWRVVVYW